MYIEANHSWGKNFDNSNAIFSLIISRVIVIGFDADFNDEYPSFTFGLFNLYVFVDFN